MCVGWFRGGLHVGGRVHRSGRKDEEVVVRLDFGVGSRVGEGEEEEEQEDRVGVLGRLNDIGLKQVRVLLSWGSRVHKCDMRRVLRSRTSHHSKDRFLSFFLPPPPASIFVQNVLQAQMGRCSR